LATIALLACLDAAAAATLTRSWRNGSLSLFVADGAGATVFLDNIGYGSSGTANLAEFRGTNLAPPGLGVSAAFGGSQVSGFVPAAAPIGSAFDGVVVSAASGYVRGGQDTADYDTTVTGTSRMFADFTLDAPMRWHWSADEVVGTSSGTGRTEYIFGLYDNDSANLDAVFERTLTGNFDVVDSAGGVLPAGNWALVISLITRMEFAFVAGTGDHSLYLSNGRFSLTPVPAPGAIALLAPAVCGLLAARRKVRPGT
ncbi:MAG: hypothetical protein RLW62_18655, partial [Gammaproteobacteria bacterium]